MHNLQCAGQGSSTRKEPMYIFLTKTKYTNRYMPVLRTQVGTSVLSYVGIYIISYLYMKASKTTEQQTGTYQNMHNLQRWFHWKENAIHHSIVGNWKSLVICGGTKFLWIYGGMQMLMRLCHI